MTNPFAKPTMSVGDAAELLGISRNGAYDAAKRGDIPTIKIGGRIMVISSKLREMIDTKAVAPETSLLSKFIATQKQKSNIDRRKDEQEIIELLADIITDRIMKRLEAQS